MGQVFTDKVDVTKLKEGRCVIATTLSGATFRGVLEIGESGNWWVSSPRAVWCICTADGQVDPKTASVELLDDDPAEKMLAEHAEMLAILEEISDAPWSNGDVRNMARDFLANRKAQQ